MSIRLELLTVATVAIVPHLLSSILFARNREGARAFAKSHRLLSGVTFSAGTLCLMLYIASNHQEGQHYVGLPAMDELVTARVAWVALLATGYLLLPVVALRFRSPGRQEVDERIQEDIFEAGGWSQVDGFGDKLARLSAMWLNVVAEDLVFRGYLLFALPLLTGWVLPWLALSVALAVIAHLYQGTHPRLMFTHAVFAAVLAAAALAGGSIVAAIIPHLTINTVWALRGWAKMSGPTPT